MLKKILKFTGWSILSIVLALFVASYVFKDKILAEFKSQLSQNLNATIDFKDFDVSFLKSFPDVSIEIGGLSVIGVDTFNNIPLLLSDKTQLDLSVLPFFKKDLPLSIDYFGLENASVNMVVLNDTLANYLISKSSEDTSSFTLAVDAYEIKNSKLFYNDQALNFKTKAIGLNHRGTGNIGSDIYDLKTSTSIDSLTINFEGITYLNDIATKMDALINVNMPETHFTFSETAIELNKLKLKGSASMKARDGGWEIKTDIKNEGNTFRDFISVLPFLDQNKDVKADGMATLAVKAEGYYNGDKGLYPAFDFIANISNGSAQYTGLPYPLKNVQLDARINSKDPQLKDLMVDVKKLNLSVNQEIIASKFTIKDGMTNALLDGSLKAGINIENWTKALPLKGVEQCKGRIDSDLSLHARQSDIEKENYQNIKFTGSLKGRDIVYKAENMPVISIPICSFDASPSEMILKGAQISAGRSKFDFAGTIKNPLAYFSDVKNVGGSIEVKGEDIDLNEWSTPTSSSPTPTVPMDLSTYKFNEVTANLSAQTVHFGEYILKNFNLKGNFGLQHINVSEMSTQIGNSDIRVSGVLANVYDYIFEGGLLSGKLDLVSNNFDANQFMVSEPTQSSADTLFRVPNNVAIDLSGNIKKLLYTNHVLSNVSSKISIKDQAMSIYECTANMMGGQVAIEGLYDSKAEKPDFNLKLNLNSIRFPEAFGQMITIKKLAPVMKYIEGIFNTTLVLNGKLNDGMLPDLSTLSASGLIETLNGSIKGLKPLGVASEKLGLNTLNPMSLKDTKNWFDIKDGVVEIKEFNKELGDIGLRMKGSHKIQGPMNYEMILKIPREKLKKSGLTKGIESGWSFIEKEASKKGVDIAQGAFIDVKVTLGGLLSNPDVKFTFLGTSGKSMKEEIQDEVKKSIEETKDSIKNAAKQKVEFIRDSIRRAGEREIEKAKQKATEEANKVVDDAKNKAQKAIEAKVDTLVSKVVSDSLKKKAEEVIKNKSGKEVDEIKDKIKDWNPFKKKK